jgi:serine/threonine protein kinase/tetratricopeptide (TPR) repeat protein
VSGEERLAAIFGAWRERIERGEDVDPEEVVRGHPDLADELRRRFFALRMAERAFAGDEATDGRAPESSLVGRSLGAYHLVSVLGSGGMGTVFLAQDGDSRVAVKVLHAHLLGRHGFFKRFLREAELGRRVRHENVVATLDAGAAEIDGAAVHYLVMEQVEGRTLRALLDELGRVPEELCRHIGGEIARALVAIHAAGAVHRDLKPDNVLITRDHVVKVMDLGVARLRDEAARLSQTGAFVGSVRYGSPEQIQDAAAVDGRADLHALGLLLYELSTGVHPFAGEDVRMVLRKILDEKPRRAAELNPQLSPLFEELLAHLLDKDREKRPASAGDVARILADGEESAWWRERASAIRRETQRPLRRIRIQRETALYGRDAELTLLRSLYERASEGEGQVALVEGEAGIGKSRLVDEFVGLLAQAGEDVNFLYGSYPPGGAATASGAFSTAYREYLGDDESAIRAALPQTPLLMPAFAALLRGDVAPTGAEPLTKDSLQTVFVHATRSFAAHRPTIVLIDDLHFAPHEGRALFAALSLAVPGHRVLLVGTARPEVDAAWVAQVGRSEHVSRIQVPRLGAKDLVLLLRDSLRSEHLAEELAAKIAVKSDGNPFFVFEILRGLREGQFITKRSDGTWATTREIREIVVPSSIVELVQARVSGLSRVERDVLEVASCVGFEFDAALVGDVLKIERIPLLQRLGAIEKSHRLVRSAGRRFVFDHHQIQETLYAGISETLREEYHAAIGTAIEVRNGAASKEPKDLDGALCVDLAEHLLKGAQGPRALRYLDAALTHLERNYLNDAAVRLASLALSLRDLTVGEGREALLIRLSTWRGHMGCADEQRAALGEALELAEAAGDARRRVTVQDRMAWHLISVARYAEAERVLRAALELARASGDRTGEADVTRSIGVVLHKTGRSDEARVHSERALAFWTEVGDVGRAARLMGDLGNVFESLGQYETARAFQERYAEFARNVGDRRAEAIALGNLGNIVRDMGRLEESRVHQERALLLARQTGDRRTEARATGSLGSVLDDLGRGEESLAHRERHLALSRETGERSGEAIASGNLGIAFAAAGRLAQAREFHERHLELAREIRFRMGEAIALVNLGSLRRRLGAGDGARREFGASLVVCEEIGAQRVAGYALKGLGDTARGESDLAEAARRYSETLDLWRRIGYAPGVAWTLVALGGVRIEEGREEEADSLLGEAADLAREIGSVGPLVLAAAERATFPADRVGEALRLLSEYASQLDADAAMRTRLLLHRATSDIAHLAEAKRILDHLVAHAPADCRETMVANVRLHRDIAAAARERRVPPAGPGA